MDEENVIVSDTIEDGKLPIAICKQAAMKLDSFIADIHEICEDEEITDEYRESFKKIAEYSNWIMANMIAIIQTEMGEDTFVNIEMKMDEIEEYPEPKVDIMDEEL